MKKVIDRQIATFTSATKTMLVTTILWHLCAIAESYGLYIGGLTIFNTIIFVYFWYASYRDLSYYIQLRGRLKDLWMMKREIDEEEGTVVYYVEKEAFKELQREQKEKENKERKKV